ncbi:MAG: PIN domain-containing protein [Rhodospirillales bacterium]|nr:PIN domain-containing protein [Rhodospirillales bacterium]
MDRIFIDANIWLDFYDGRLKDIGQLLETLQALTGHLILPKQVVFEVHRNRVNRYLNSINSSMKQDTTFDMEFGRLPDVTEECASWNKGLKELREEFKGRKEAIYQQRVRIVSEHTEAVCLGTDDASRTFETIFKNCIEATDPEIELARLRKDRGNPPGKRNDSLGDQICWEQILSTLNDGDRLWIISRDGDYTVSNGEGLFLDPLLMYELRSKFDTLPEVHCFTDLPKALKHFKTNKSERENFSIPSDQDLDKIANEYREVQAGNISAMAKALLGLPPSDNYEGPPGWIFGIPPYLQNSRVRFSTLLGGIKPEECPNCGASLVGNGWISRASSSRAETYQTVCGKCQEWIDSGIPWN